MSHNWTHHGHACCSAMPGKRPKTMVINRCGGPAICNPCARDAAASHTEAPITLVEDREAGTAEDDAEAYAARVIQLEEELARYKDGVVVLNLESQLSKTQHDLLVERARIARLSQWIRENGRGRLRTMDPIEAAIRMLTYAHTIGTLPDDDTPPPYPGRPIRDNPQA